MDKEFSNLIESELERVFSYVTKSLGKKMDDYSFIIIKYKPDKKKKCLYQMIMNFLYYWRIV